MSYHTYTDRQGEDNQETTATSIIFDMNLLNNMGVAGYYQYTSANHDITYSYDGDWGNNQMWINDFSWDPAWDNYDYFDNTLRNRKTNTHEFRIHTNELRRLSIISGFYHAITKEKDIAEGYLFAGEASNINTLFDILNIAGYGQLKYSITHNTKLMINLRGEQHKTNYKGESEKKDNIIMIPSVEEEITHSHFGGKIALLHNLNSTISNSMSISKGFKAGGVNQNPHLSMSSRLYSPEHNALFITNAFLCCNPPNS